MSKVFKSYTILNFVNDNKRERYDENKDVEYKDISEIVSLDLHYKNIEEIPSSIGSLFALQQVNINKNCIKILPDEICNLSALHRVTSKYRRFA